MKNGPSLQCSIHNTFSKMSTGKCLLELSTDELCLETTVGVMLIPTQAGQVTDPQCETGVVSQHTVQIGYIQVIE